MKCNNGCLYCRISAFGPGIAPFGAVAQTPANFTGFEMFFLCNFHAIINSFYFTVISPENNTDELYIFLYTNCLFSYLCSTVETAAAGKGK